MSKPQSNANRLMFRSEITQAQEFSFSYTPSMKDIEEIKQKLTELGVDLTSKDSSSKHK